MPDTLTQSAFRNRNDDGSETTATWLAALNANALPTLDSPFRVRMQTTTEGGLALINYTNRLHYTLNGGAKTAVTTTSNVIRAVNSANVTNDEATTEQLAGAGVFQAGVVSEDGTCPLNFLSNNALDVEDEFVVQLRSADLHNNDVVRLYCTQEGSDLDGYTQVPTYTISGLGTARIGLLPLTGAG